jgi:oligoribonuclease NrnB/cAMP/cGMP phosphodiesterase (DHH superfamily)
MGQSTDEIYAVHDIDQDIILDNSRSGALLAFDWFFSRAEMGGVPKLIAHIDDRDRWQFRLHNSREFHAALQLIKPWTFEQWDRLNDSFSTDYSNYTQFVQRGAAALEVEQRQITSAALKSYDCMISYEDAQGDLHTVKGLAINSTVHMSEVGHELANASGTYGLIYYIDKDASAKCSLRSNGDYDVSVIAKFFGGGGHKNAAGFTTSLDILKQFITGSV